MVKQVPLLLLEENVFFHLGWQLDVQYFMKALGLEKLRLYFTRVELLISLQ